MVMLRYLPRFREAYRMLPILAEREQWPRERIEAFQLDRLNTVWKHAAEYCPYYHTLAIQQRLPQQFASLQEYRERMPVLTKPTLLQSCQQVLSRHKMPGFWKLTSGSTGQPIKIYWGSKSYLESLRARYRNLQSWGVDFLERSAFLWGHITAFVPGWEGRLQRLRQPVEDWLRDRLRLPAYTLTPEVLQQHLRRLLAFKPHWLYSYSTAAYLLAMQAEASRTRVDSLRVITLTAEPAYPHMRQVIERAFGVPTAVEYGSIECGVMASEGPDRRLRVREDIVYLETEPRSDGQFDLLITTLYNPSFPLFRYRIGDLTDQPIERPATGFGVLHQILGRSLDLLRGRNGTVIHPFIVEEMFQEFHPPLSRWQIHQHKDGSTHVLLQAAGPADSIDVTPLRNEVSRMLEGYPIEIQVVDRIPSLPSGKFRYVLSDMMGPIDQAPPNAPR